MNAVLDAYKIEIERQQESLIRQLTDLKETIEQSLDSSKEPDSQVFALEHDQLSQYSRRAERTYHEMIANMGVIYKVTKLTQA